MSIKKFVKSIIDDITDNFKIKDVIIFESVPEYSDNTKAVFDEMVRRNHNDKYKFVWACENKDKIGKLNNKFSNVNNVEFVYNNSFLYKFYYRKVAKMFIVCNWLLLKAKKEQYYCDLAHGCALKNATNNNYSLPKSCSDADVLTISNYMAKYDAHNLNCDVNCMKPLGYPRNDDLFNNIDLHKYFCDIDFDKAIYWLPTYRQNKWGNVFHSDISMPIIHNEKIACSLNEYAKNNKVLIIVKIHPSQDISKISEFNYSNLIFIKNDFFEDKDITNYQLLGSCDALISDYSSVYYDYLLADKPIGLCFEDFDEYNEREGFTLDPNLILAGGVKIYNCDDMCDFISDIANGNDILKDKRNEIKNLVHSNTDNLSTKRVVDYLEKVVL